MKIQKMEKHPGKKDPKKSFLLFIISFFGSGLISKKMPGTIGSIFATFTILILPRSYLLIIYISIILFLIGYLFCRIYIPKYDNNNKDPGYIVIDEACSIFLGCGILFYFGYTSVLDIFINFILFRFFDIFKPFPIKNIENHMKKNDKTVELGIMLDDIIAVFFAVICQLFGYYLFLNI